jgi:ABC-2 type transport system ATP-binding protein
MQERSDLQAIQVQQLTRKFGSFVAVDGLSFEVYDGEVFGLLGPNGAGKTTTIRLLTCLISPTEGSAKVCGFEVTKEPAKVRELVGILTENPCLYERLTPYENMDFFAQAYSVSIATDRNERIHELLQFFDLWDKREQRVALLSKGMKQKLALARALVHKPRVLLLDEPTAGLDPESAVEVRNMITRLSDQEGRAIMLCTHRLEDAEKLCDRVMIIDKGKRIIDGTPETLRRRLAGPPVIEVIVRNEASQMVNSIRSVPSVKAFTIDSQRRLLITVNDPESAAPEVVAAIVHAGGQILSVKVLEPSLEDVYLQLIKESAH